MIELARRGLPSSLLVSTAISSSFAGFFDFLALWFLGLRFRLAWARAVDPNAVGSWCSGRISGSDGVWRVELGAEGNIFTNWASP